jgi:hypothetical protein
MGTPQPPEDDDERQSAAGESGGGDASDGDAGGAVGGGGAAGEVWDESSLAKAEEARHGRNLPAEEPAARFHARERPQRYATRPLDPIVPYLPPPVARRRRSDWPVMVLVMVIASIVMVGFCVAGFAFYSGYGVPFLNK